MTKLIKLNIFLILLFLFSINVFAQQPKQTSIVVINFVKSKPGLYAETLKYYEQGWLKARVEAKKRQYIKSYKLLTLGENDESKWNLMLITEFENQQSYDASEENFKKVFAKVSPQSVLINGKTGNDLRTVVLTKIMNAPALEKK